MIELVTRGMGASLRDAAIKLLIGAIILFLAGMGLGAFIGYLL